MVRNPSHPPRPVRSCYPPYLVFTLSPLLSGITQLSTTHRAIPPAKFHLSLSSEAFPGANTYLTVIILYSIAFLVMTGLYKYAPQSAVYVKQRTTYYLLGQEPETSAESHIASWVARNLTGEL